MRPYSRLSRAVLGGVLLLMGSACAVLAAGATSAPSGSAATKEERIRVLEKELDAAKKRVQEITDELDRLKASESSAAAPAAAASGKVAVNYIAFPSRRISGLGVYEKTEARISGPVAGAKKIAILPASSSPVPAEITIDSDESSPLTNVFCKHPTQGKVCVATLKMKPEGLFWTWLPASPAGLSQPLANLDASLKSSLIEVSAGGTALSRFQIAPAEVDVRMSQRVGTAVLPLLNKDVRLVAGEPPRGIQTLGSGDYNVRFVSGDILLSLTVDPSGKTVLAEWIDSSEDRATDKEITAELKSLEEDNKRLATRRESLLSRYSTGSTGGTRSSSTVRRPVSAYDPATDGSGTATVSSSYAKRTLQEIDEQLDKNKKRIAELQEKRRLQAAKSKPKTFDCSKCEAHVVLPNEVILYRIKMRN